MIKLDGMGRYSKSYLLSTPAQPNPTMIYDTYVSTPRMI